MIKKIQSKLFNKYYILKGLNLFNPFFILYFWKKWD